VYFEGSCLAEELLGVVPGVAPLILYVPMFPWNFIFLQNKKEEGSKKRVVYIRIRGGSSTRAFS